jgi:hypothetical protein
MFWNASRRHRSWISARGGQATNRRVLTPPDVLGLRQGPGRVGRSAASRTNRGCDMTFPSTSDANTPVPIRRTAVASLGPGYTTPMPGAYGAIADMRWYAGARDARRQLSAEEDPVVEEAIGILMHRLDLGAAQASAIFDACAESASIRPRELARTLARTIVEELDRGRTSGRPARRRP